jgi:aminopeptidase
MSDFLSGDPRLEKWAQIIVDFCTEVQNGERVEITGDVSGKPLMLALYRKCLENGAYPVIKPSFEETSEIFYSAASEKQLKHLHPISIFEASHTDVSLHIMAENNTQCLSAVEPSKIASVRIARKKISRIRKEKIRWNITSFPTQAYAQDAAMSRAEFAEFIFGAGLLNTPDPLAEWKKLRQRQQRITKILQGAKLFHLQNATIDLKLGVEGRCICESSGKVNMPDGEIYTGPDEGKVNGKVHFSFPGYFMGQIVQDIELIFKNGKVVEYSAGTNESFLTEMLNTDSGAKRIGELGIGTNWGIQRFTKNLLFDEKMGGTIHLALGDAYRETLGKNRSAIHWDIIHDMRSDSRIYVDRQLFMENGDFAGKFSEIWNE